MFKGRNLFTLVIVLVAILSSHFWTAHYYEQEIKKNLGIINDLENGKEMSASYGGKKSSVSVGVVIPNRLLAKDSEKDWKYAESFFATGHELTRLKTGTLPGVTDQTAFSFKCSVSAP